jgi:hypothetical protein
MPAQENSTLKETSSTSGERVKHEPEKDLIAWQATARPFKRRNREFYITVIAIAAVIGLILFLVEGFMPVILIISLVFLFYVLSTVEPEEIQYKLTNKGIYIAERKTEWENLIRFWFSRRFDSQLLIIETFSLPGRLELVIDPGQKDEIRKTLLNYIPEEETPASGLDRAANWFSKRLPGN